MATIDQLTTSILDMADDEVFTLIKTMRQSRRTRPETYRTHKKAAKGSRNKAAVIKKGSSKLELDTLVKTLTPEQKAGLLKQLGVDV